MPQTVFPAHLWLIPWPQAKSSNPQVLGGHTVEWKDNEFWNWKRPWAGSSLLPSLSVGPGLSHPAQRSLSFSPSAGMTIPASLPERNARTHRWKRLAGVRNSVHVCSFLPLTLGDCCTEHKNTRAEHCSVAFMATVGGWGIAGRGITSWRGLFSAFVRISCWIHVFPNGPVRFVFGRLQYRNNSFLPCENQIVVFLTYNETHSWKLSRIKKFKGYFRS